MFEAAEVGSKVGKQEYNARVDELRVELVNAQYDMRAAGFSVIVLIAGDDRIAANEMVDLLNYWMDARFIDTRVFLLPSDEERERPRFWRYWRSLPAHGRTGLFMGGWAMNTIAEHLRRNISKSVFEDRIRHDRRFEQSLSVNGTLILKYWLHLPARKMRSRLDAHPDKSDWKWRMQEIDWDIYKKYDRFISLASQYIRETDCAHTPWQIIESTDTRYRNLALCESLLSALQARLNATHKEHAEGEGAAGISVSGDVLGNVDLDSSIPYDRYKARQKKLQERLGKLTVRARDAGQSAVLLFEGWDAAGKGGVIRRLTRSMAARDYRVIPVMAPTDEELAHHYLWRFWRHMPRAGRMLIFDRSWYGRVLVERVEGLASEQQWRRAYGELNDFEEQLTDYGLPVIKFWLHIDADEQLRRFRARETTPYKKYKITDEDYRNREKRDAYAAAVNEMVARTSTEYAPWHLVPANDKRYARIAVMEQVCDRLLRVLNERHD
jgi:polyphosphate:AMP phosphotransferase